MDSTGNYLLRRIGRPMTFPFAGPAGRWGLPDRRDYTIIVRGMNGPVAIAEVSHVDCAADGKVLSKTPKAVPAVQVNISGAATPVEAFEDIARAADPDMFQGVPRKEPADRAGLWAGCDKRIVDLRDPKNRGEGEASPEEDSVARFIAFRTMVPTLLPPDLFSTKEGVIRGRWQDGASRTFWISFASKGPLGWSCAIPRQGDVGIIRVNARCSEDRDIPQAARLLGVRITRS